MLFLVFAVARLSTIKFVSFTSHKQTGRWIILRTTVLDCDPQICVKENSTDRRRGKKAQARTSFQVRQSFNKYIKVE